MGILKLNLNTKLVRFYCDRVQPVVMKYLNVAEKNDAAKNIAAILSRGNSNRREGLSTYNKIYEFNCTVMGQQTHMIMTSVSGHLLNYEFVGAYRRWQSCNPIALFDAPVFKSCPEDYQRIKKTLEREIRSCQGLIIWTDCDREGENIGFEIIKVCTDVKTQLQIYRAKFSEITAASIFRAINNLSAPNSNINNAVDVRQELDLRTGAAFTRLQTLRLQKVFPQQLSEKLISYGSCQFPTLGFVVDRYKIIEQFVPEPFWRIKMNHTVKELTTDFNWKRDRLFNKDCCQAILDICEENSLATVEFVDRKPKSKWRPLPLDTVEMEKSISRKLRINAKETMKIAEKLYSQGYISYPRTETNIFPKELNLIPLVEQQTNDPQWGPFAQRIINEGGPNPRVGKKTDQAHPPIHPIKYINNLSGNEQRIYEFIVRHFLACVSKDAQGHETIVNVDIAGEKFIAKGLIVLEKNYLDVYIYDKWNTKEINNYETGDTFTPTELTMVEGTTTPPKLLTEADLIALMEQNGIGTDATHAEHIDTIKSRQYVGLHDNIYFVPGTLGMGLVEGYDEIGLQISLAKPTLRAEFENDLKLICEGRKNAEEVRVTHINKYRAIFQKVMEKMRCIDQMLAVRLDAQPNQLNDELAITQEQFKPIMKCPKCGTDMVIKTRKNGQGKYLSCLNYPNCKNVVWFSVNVEQIDVLDENCLECNGNVKKVKMRFKHNVFPGYPNPSVLCIGGCDSIVLETLDININNVRKQNSHIGNNQRESSIVSLNQTHNNLGSRNVTNSAGNLLFGNNQQNGSFAATSSNSGNARNKKDKRATSSTTTKNRGTKRNFLDNTNNSLGLMPGPSTSRNYGHSSSQNVNQDGDVLCSCGQVTILLTVRKEGPNTGRQFHKCQKGQAQGGCDFFLWHDEDGANNNSGVNHQADPNAPQCNCNLPTVKRTVQKDGPNKGRMFYSCPKSFQEKCNFFQWADEENTNGNNSSRWDGGDDRNRPHWNNAGGGNNSWKGKTKKAATKKKTPYNNQVKTKRKCGICGVEGHTRTTCPNA